MNTSFPFLMNRPAAEKSPAPSGPAHGKSRRYFRALGILLLTAAGVSTASGQTPSTPIPPPTPFNYQAVLKMGGSPANGLYDLRAWLQDTNGVPIGPPLTNVVSANEGLVSVNLDFGAVLIATGGFLQPDPIPPLLGIGIRPHGSQSGFTPIGPAQPFLYAPFAVNAMVAAQSLRAASNSVGPGALQPGIISPDILAPSAVTGPKLADGAVTGAKISEGAIYEGHILGGQVLKSLNGLTDHISLVGGNDMTITPSANGLVFGVVRSCLDYTNCYWNLRGNGNTVDGVNFLGTINSVPLSLRVNNQRVMRYEHTGISPNLIGGHSLNLVAGAIGATIGGGGASSAENSIAGNFGTIGGGVDHTIGLGALYATIGGGTNNEVSDAALGSTIAGGADNRIAPATLWGTIAGGRLNLVSTSAPSATIGGGFGNSIRPGVSTATIGGGSANFVNANLATIGGGSSNRIETIAHRAAIGGGYFNRIESNAVAAVVGGGMENVIEPSSRSATISGGQTNRIAFMASLTTIAGGEFNFIGPNATGATVGGGVRQAVYAPFGVIDGGTDNYINNGAANGVIGGGAGNSIGTSALNATIAGGTANAVWFGAENAVMGGGRGNTVNPNAASSTIAGGNSNVVFSSAPFAAIPGGSQAAATNFGQLAYASGSFDEPGDAQASLYLLRGETLNGATNELFLDGVGERIKIRPGSSVTFRVQFTGRSSVGETAAYDYGGVIKNDYTGLTQLVGSGRVQQFEEAATAACEVLIAADDASDALSIRVVGASGTVMRWVARVTTTEVKW